MDRRAKLVAVALLLGSSFGAHAYVTPAAPPGFSAGTSGGWTYAPPSASAQLNSIMRGAGPSIAGAGETRAAYKLGGSAARVLAARAITGAIPGVGLALAVGWIASNCFEKQGATWVRTCGGSAAPQSSGYEYITDDEFNNGGAIPFWHPTKEAACILGLAKMSISSPYNYGFTGATFTGAGPNAAGNCMANWVHKTTGQNPFGGPVGTATFRFKQSGCPVGWYFMPNGTCSQNQPTTTVTPQEVEDELATKPLPSTLPGGVPYPIELPTIFNPTETNPAQPQPLRVPTGNPVPVPNSDPQKWSQPATRYTPSPTATDPWRMDVTPENVPSDNPTGMTGPQPVTSGAPPGEPTEKELDLCEKNPDILACQKLDQPESEELPDKPIELTFTPDSGWGAENAQCPAARHISAGGHDVPIPFDLFCQYMSGIRPIVIAMAFLSAALIIVGFKGSD